MQIALHISRFHGCLGTKNSIITKTHGGVMKLLVLLSIALFAISCGTVKFQKLTPEEKAQTKVREFHRPDR
jgi:hypothetical protein